MKLKAFWRVQPEGQAVTINGTELSVKNITIDSFFDCQQNALL